MLRAPSPEIVSESNFTSCAASRVGINRMAMLRMHAGLADESVCPTVTLQRIFILRLLPGC